MILILSAAGLSTLLLNKIEKHFTEWAVRKGASFVICSLLSSPPTQPRVIEIVRKNRKALQQSSEAGCVILLKDLEKVAPESAKDKVYIHTLVGPLWQHCHLQWLIVNARCRRLRPPK